MDNKFSILDLMKLEEERIRRDENGLELSGEPSLLLDEVVTEELTEEEIADVHDFCEYFHKHRRD